MKFIGVIVFVLASSAAWADFNGEWKGQGTFKQDKDYSQECETIEFEIVETATEFKINRGLVKCGLLNWSWNPVNLTKRNQELVDAQGRSIGTLVGDDLHIEQKGRNNTQSVYDMSIRGGQMMYKQVVSSPATEYVIDGILSK